MNRGDYMGRIAKEISLNESGKMATGTVAVDRPFPFGKDAEGNKITDFFNIRIIGEKQASRAEQYLTKGIKIAFSGINCRDNFKDKDGNWKEYNYIIVTDWEFAESKGSSEANAADEDSDGFVNVPDGIDEELPFN